jgi:hypothetical protein
MIEFLHSIPCLSKQSNMQLKRFQHCLVKKKYIRKQFVYKVGQAAEFVYIVKKGEFVVERDLPKNDTQTTQKLTEMLGQRNRD